MLKLLNFFFLVLLLFFEEILIELLWMKKVNQVFIVWNILPIVHLHQLKKKERRKIR